MKKVTCNKTKEKILILSEYGAELIKIVASWSVIETAAILPAIVLGVSRSAIPRAIYKSVQRNLITKYLSHEDTAAFIASSSERIPAQYAAAISPLLWPTTTLAFTPYDSQTLQ